jgi:hypothetical protein
VKLAISYKHMESQESVDREVKRHVQKLDIFCNVMRQILVQLHGTFGVNARKEIFVHLKFIAPGGIAACDRYREKSAGQAPY